MTRLLLRNRVRRLWRQETARMRRSSSRKQSRKRQWKMLSGQMMTRLSLRNRVRKRMETMRKAAVAKAEPVTHLSTPLEENLNRVEIEGESASSVTEAIKVLSIAQDEKVDKHPEKRMKAAYTEFEERRLQELKAENKSLKLSQLKQMIFKEWQKHPDNPLNKQ